MQTSHLADILTRLRNGQVRNKKEVLLGPQSKFCRQVLNCLVQEGWLSRWYFKSNPNQKFLKNVWVSLKVYSSKPVIRELVLISKPSRKVYVSLTELSSHVLNQNKSTEVRNSFKAHPFNTWILSTSKGVLTGTTAFKLKVGGELLCCIR